MHVAAPPPPPSPHGHTGFLSSRDCTPVAYAPLGLHFIPQSPFPFLFEILAKMFILQMVHSPNASDGRGLGAGNTIQVSYVGVSAPSTWAISCYLVGHPQAERWNRVQSQDSNSGRPNRKINARPNIPLSCSPSGERYAEPLLSDHSPQVTNQDRELKNALGT